MSTDLRDLPEYQQLARAFEIFASYPGEQHVATDTDQIYAGPNPAVVSAEHLADLAALGWEPDPGSNTFYRWT